jgi:hypothetical protein
MPRIPIATPTYQYPAPPGSYFPTLPANVSFYMQQPTSRSQPPNSHFPFLYYGASTNAAYKDATIANAWLQEWQTISKDFEPSRPLSLLFEPASINMATYARKTGQVHLNHWDRDHEPDGTTTQRLTREAKKSQKLKKNLTCEELKQEARRSKVKQAAQKAEIVDLTEDDGIANEPPWRNSGIENAESHAPGFGGQDRKTLEALARQDKLLAQISHNPTAYNLSYTRSKPQAAFGTSHH